MGFVHGLSNMGGAILSILATSHFKQKTEIRGAVVFCYWFFGIIQIVSLFLFSKSNFSVLLIFIIPLVSVVYLLIGRITFRYLNEKLYQSLLTFFIFCFSILLIIKDWPRETFILYLFSWRVYPIFNSSISTFFICKTYPGFSLEKSITAFAWLWIYPVVVLNNLWPSVLSG